MHGSIVLYTVLSVNELFGKNRTGMVKYIKTTCAMVRTSYKL